MINLLPTEEKKLIVNQYHHRVFVFYISAISICFAVGAIALLPAYFLSSLKERLAEEKLQSVKNLPVPELDQKTVEITKDVNSKLSLIEDAEKNQFSVLENAINKIILRKTPDIKLIVIDYEKDKDGSKTINLRGVAPNRERLLLFRQSLESDPSFSDINLPISNFVKGSNIDFRLSLSSS